MLPRVVVAVVSMVVVDVFVVNPVLVALVVVIVLGFTDVSPVVVVNEVVVVIIELLTVGIFVLAFSRHSHIVQ